MSADDWSSLTQEQFSRIFTHSAVKRTKLEGLLRNIQCAKTKAQS
jgi:epoxyqueuosine reductase